MLACILVCTMSLSTFSGSVPSVCVSVMLKPDSQREHVRNAVTFFPG